MLKSSLLNQPHLFKIKIKDRDVLNFSFFIINHFAYSCMGREGRRDSMYQILRLRIHREGGQKFLVLTYVIHLFLYISD